MLDKEDITGVKDDFKKWQNYTSQRLQNTYYHSTKTSWIKIQFAFA